MNLSLKKGEQDPLNMIQSFQEPNTENNWPYNDSSISLLFLFWLIKKDSECIAQTYHADLKPDRQIAICIYILQP